MTISAMPRNKLYPRPASAKFASYLCVSTVQATASCHDWSCKQTIGKMFTITEKALVIESAYCLSWDANAKILRDRQINLA